MQRLPWQYEQQLRLSCPTETKTNRINKLTSVFHASVLSLCPVIDHEVCHNIVKVVVDPQSDSRVNPQTTLTML